MSTRISPNLHCAPRSIQHPLCPRRPERKTEAQRGAALASARLARQGAALSPAHRAAGLAPPWPFPLWAASASTLPTAQSPPCSLSLPSVSSQPQTSLLTPQGPTDHLSCYVPARASSGGLHGTLNPPVLFSPSHEESTKYLNFSASEEKESSVAQHRYQVCGGDEGAWAGARDGVGMGLSMVLPYCPLCRSTTWGPGICLSGSTSWFLWS